MATMDYSSAPYGLPPAARYAGVVGVKYDPILNLFNLKQSNTRKIRAALAKSLVGTGNAKIAEAGDSTTAGFNSAAATQAPAVILRNLLGKYGYNVKGTGPVIANARGATGTGINQSDSRWAFTGTWTNQAGNTNGLLQTTVANDFAVFTSDLAGDTVEWSRLNLGGTYTYSIDGAAAVSVNDASTGLMDRKSVTGLANTTHTLRLTAVTGTLYPSWASVHSSASGILVGNFGVGGSTASGWDNTLNYFPGPVCTDWGADLTIYNIGINDVGAATPVDQIKASIQSNITKFKATGDVILTTSNPHESLDFSAINQAKYELAVSNDIPLLDITDRFESYAISNPLGLYTDAAHPSAAGYADIGLAQFRCLVGG